MKKSTPVFKNNNYDVKLNFNQFIYVYADEIICVSLVVTAVCSVLLCIFNVI